MVHDSEYNPVLHKSEARTKAKRYEQKYIRYEEAERIYGLSHKLLRNFAEKAGAIVRFSSTMVLVDKERFDAYFETFREKSTIGWNEGDNK